MSPQRLLLATLLSIAAASSAAGQAQGKPIDPANIDSTCHPCQDFFQYANGGWLKRSEIPGDLPRWGSFNELQEQNFAALEDVLTDAARTASSTADPNIRKLGTFYGTCMDSTAIESAGLTPLTSELKQIDGIRDRAGVELAIARLHRIGIPAAFAFTSKPDAKRSSRTIAELYQAGLGLPDRDYYTKTDSASEKIRSEYVRHVANMLRLSGHDSSTTAASARRIIELETALAEASMTREAQRDPESIYHLTRASDLPKITPRFSWQRYLSSHGLKNVTEINVAQPAFMSRVDSLLGSTPVDT
jgi:putative endopeptidase